VCLGLRPAALNLHLGKQLVSKCIQLAGTIWNLERGFHNIRPKIFSDRVP
jgi:hypothetical protein